MKLWEVLKELEENRDKKYKMVSKFGKIHEIGLDNNGYYAFSSIFDGKNIDDKPSGGFSGNVYRDADWKEVKQPVTWQEAIEAWANGKRIKYENERGCLTYSGNTLKDEIGPLASYQLTTGTWYIEED